MAYTDGEAAILARIQAHADYSSSNTDANDWKKLDSGESAYYAILKPGTDPAELEFFSFSAYRIFWKTVIEVWQRYEDDGTTASSLFGNVQKIIAQLQPYKKLGLTNTQNAEITNITAPSYRWDKDGGPAWLVQEITETWLEEVEVTFV